MKRGPGQRRDEKWFRVVADRAIDGNPDALVHPQAKLGIGPLEILVRNSETITIDPDGKLVGYRDVSDVERAEYGWTQKQERLTGRVLPASLSGPSMPPEERLDAPQGRPEAQGAPGDRPESPYHRMPLVREVSTLGELLEVQIIDDQGEVWSVGEILEEWKEMRRELEEDDDVAG